MRRLLFPVLVLAAASVPAQIQPENVVVATELQGSPRTQLFESDIRTGVSVPLGRFNNDGFAPLAVTIDPANRDLIVALDMVGTTRESVNKQLRAWEEDGIVELGRGRVVLKQPEALEEVLRAAEF